MAESKQRQIYFAGSISGGRDDQPEYETIVALLKGHGEVLSAHVADATLTQKGEDLPDQDIYDRDVKWVKSCDVLVAEVTNPSLGVGYEIRTAEVEGKKILCLYKRRPEKRLSPMISAADVTVKEYDTEAKLGPILDDFFKNM